MEQSPKVSNGQIDLTKNAMYLVADGKLTLVPAPESGHGEQTVVWKRGLPIDVVKTERQRVGLEEI